MAMWNDEHADLRNRDNPPRLLRLAVAVLLLALPGVVAGLVLAAPWVAK